MSLSASIQSYGDCLDFFEKIVDDPKGGRIFIGSHADASHFRLRCNQARKLDRQQNARIYETGDKRHGTSDFDQFCLRVRQDTEGGWWVYAERMQLDANAIELLSEIEDVPQIEDQSPLQIEDHSSDN